MILQGGERRNNCFIATDDNAVISENNRFKNRNLLFRRSLMPAEQFIHLFFKSIFSQKLDYGRFDNLFLAYVFALAEFKKQPGQRLRHIKAFGPRYTRHGISRYGPGR